MTGREYIRSDDGARMIEIAPHQFVSADALKRLSKIALNYRQSTPEQRAG